MTWPFGFFCSNKTKKSNQNFNFNEHIYKVKDKRHLHVGLQKLLSELFQDLPFSKPNTLRRSCNGSYDKLVMLRPDHSSMPGRVRQDGKKIQISEIN